MPITWRNVNGPTPDATRLFEGAQRSFSSGLSSFDSLLKDQQRLRDSNEAVGKDNAEQAFRDEIAAFRTPEELQAAQASGAIDQLRAKYSGLLDRKVARDLPNSQLQSLRQASNTDYQYGEQQAQQEAAPLYEKYQQLILDNKDGEAKALRDDNEAVFSRAGILGEASRLFKSTNEGEEDRTYTLEQRKQDKINQAFASEGRNRTRKQWVKDDLNDARQDRADEVVKMALDSGGTLAQIRSNVALAGKDKNNNLDGKTLSSIYARLPGEYAARNEITPEEAAQVDVLQANADKKLAKIPAWQRLDQPRMSLGDLNQETLKSFDIVTAGFWNDDGEKADADQEVLGKYLGESVGMVQALLNDTPYLQENGDPMRIVLEALRGTSLKDLDATGGGVDFKEIQKKLKPLVDEYVKAAQLQQTWTQERDNALSTIKSARQLREEAFSPNIQGPPLLLRK